MLGRVLSHRAFLELLLCRAAAWFTRSFGEGGYKYFYGQLRGSFFREISRVLRICMYVVERSTSVVFFFLFNLCMGDYQQKCSDSVL